MRAFVLAAGEGRRLRPFTQHTPKPLLPVGNVPLLEHSLALVHSADITRVGVNVHTHAEQIRAFLGTGERFGVEITLSEEPLLLGTGGGLRQLIERVPGEGAVLVVNADALSGCWDLCSVIEEHRRSKATATLVLRPREDDAYTPIWRGADGKVVGIGGGSMVGADAFVFTGIHVIEPRLLARLPLGKASCLIESGYRPALRHGERFSSVVTSAYWSDVGTPERLLQANLAAVQGDCRLPAGLRGERADRPRACLRDPSAILDSSAELGPGVVIGDGVEIGAGASVRSSLLLSGARVRAGEVLRNAIRSDRSEWRMEAAIEERR